MTVPAVLELRALSGCDQLDDLVEGLRHADRAAGRGDEGLVPHQVGVAERLDAAYAAQGVLLWDPLPPRLLISPLVGATLLAYATFVVALRVHRRRLPGRIDGDRAASWLHLEAKWSPYTDADDFFEMDRSETQRDEQRSGHWQEARQAPHEAPWHEVLGVAVTATEAEIKAAYREAIKGYHSDRVASLGPKLRALAEEESKRINVAYDAARKVRQFR